MSGLACYLWLPPLAGLKTAPQRPPGEPPLNTESGAHPSSTGTYWIGIPKGWCRNLYGQKVPSVILE